MDFVDPRALQISEGNEVFVRRKKLNLEPSHLAGRYATAFNSFAAGDPTHRVIASQPVGVIHIFISGETTID